MATLSVSRAAYGLCALLAAAPAAAQYIDGSPPPLPVVPLGAENAADALARNVRILAQSPRDYKALVGAGRAALATGDAEVAVGFFGRAADVWPSAAAPKAGMGAALVAMGEASHALTEFERAARLGATVSSFALDRGLARDLLGQQALAQADYTIALAGPDPDEARRRLALSQAISGNRVGALATLIPLAPRHDSATVRVRAFVAALGGDTDGADRTLEANMPGMASHLDPFFRRLASLSPAQKAAAVHLGIIPSGAGGLASASPLPSSSFASAAVPAVPATRRATSRPPAITTVNPSNPYGGDRLGGIEALFRQPAVPPVGPPATPQSATLSPLRTPSASASIAVPVPAPSRVWVQLASGLDEGALGAQFARLAARKPDLFSGIRPFVSTVGERTKLLIGPFKDRENSEIFIEELADAQIAGFSWVSPAGQPVRKLVAP